MGRRLKLVFGGHPHLWKDKDALSIYCRLSNSTLLTDRFGYLNRFSKWNIADQNTELPRTDSVNTLSDLVYARGEELVKKAQDENKSLYVLWSGGVDSTAMLLSLLECSNGSYRDIKVLYTDSSIDEYYKLYEYLRKLKGLELVKKDPDELFPYCHQVAKTDYVVSGFPADQLFGSIVGQRDGLSHNSDWKSFVLIPEAIDQFEEAFNNYNLPISTLSEFLWFMNFSSKWTMVCNFIPWLSGLDGGNSIAFFDTQGFQDWSMSNFDILHLYDQKDKLHYKKELKNFIYKIFKDDDYLYKGKIGSIGYSVAYKTKRKLSSPMKIPHISILEEGDALRTEYYGEAMDTLGAQGIEGRMLGRLLKEYRKP